MEQTIAGRVLGRSMMPKSPLPAQTDKVGLLYDPFGVTPGPHGPSSDAQPMTL
jgi:hypothetical protein